MFSNLVPFSVLLQRVKDDTGIEHISNLIPKIRRFVHRAENDLGYGGSLILKRVRYSTVKGNIIFDGKIYKLKLPPDVVRLESVGMCSRGVCPGDYLIQGNWMFFCKGKNITELDLIYYTLLTDGDGNPVITENHLEAVTAGCVYWLYKQGVYSHKKNANLMKYYEEYYHDRLGEAIGHDIMPTTMEEYSRAARILQMSSRDAFYYSPEKRCFCEIVESEAPAELNLGGSTPGDGYTTDGSGAPGGQGEGIGTGEADGDGGYIDPNAPAPVDPDPDPEPEVNQPPTIGDIEINVDAGVKTIIGIEQFEQLAGPPYSDPENDALDAALITNINPYNTGVFYLDGVPVYEDMIITRAQIVAGLFYHIGGETTHTDTLSFKVRDAVSNTWN